MKAPDQDIPSPETPQSPATPESPQTPAPAPAKAPRQKIGFLRRAVRWLLGLMIIFGLGAILIIFALYLPKLQDLDRLNGSLQAANRRATEVDQQNRQKITDLEKQIQETSSLADKNKDLQTQLDQANLHVSILSVRNDVSNARLALAKDDVTSAKMALTKTSDTLKKASGLLRADQSKAIDDLQPRLSLALSEMDSNKDNARSDLEILANNLLQIENTLFTTR